MRLEPLLLVGAAFLCAVNSASASQTKATSFPAHFQTSSPHASAIVDLSQLCTNHVCDDAFAALKPGASYHLPAGQWTFTRPFAIPSHVSLTGDGTGVSQGTDLIYAGPPTSGAAITAGSPDTDWVDGHIAALEIETRQLHDSREQVAPTWQPIDQAAVGLSITNPTGTSTVDNINVWRFGLSSILIKNTARRPGSQFFQMSDFFVGGSPRPLVIAGSNAAILLRFGGIDLSPLSELGLQFTGSTKGATSVIESVKIEGNFDIPGVVIQGNPRVVFAGFTRYLHQSLYVDTPLNSAPAILYRGDNLSTSTASFQCIGCTALGERFALALPDVGQAVPSSKWGINLTRFSSGRLALLKAAQMPSTPVTRPSAVVDLSNLCSAGNCDAAFAAMRWGGRYYLPSGDWTFTQPFAIPDSATLFGDGPRPARNGGTELQYTGSSLSDGAAVRFGSGGDMSGGRLFSIRIVSRAPLESGVGLRVVNATNASTVSNVAVEGFPDGQVLVDDGGGGVSGPGPNFVRLSDFWLSGGVHPLRIVGGRENVFIKDGKIVLGPTSEEGLSFARGEQLALTYLVESVSVLGDRDVPAFRVSSNAVVTFVNTALIAQGSPIAPAFLYSGTDQAFSVIACVACAASNSAISLAMPALGVTITRQPKAFDYRNPDTAFTQVFAPMLVHVPTITGPPVLGKTLSASNGTWTNTPTSFSYEWLRCPRPAASNPDFCASIPGTGRQDYSPTFADAGNFVRIKVTARNASGDETAVSSPLFVSS